MIKFKSFYMGGFECADHINRSGERVNLLRDTQHDSRAFEDYQLLKEVGILVVREGICWSEVEKEPFQYDFSGVTTRLQAADTCGIQIIWDICHFGYPDGLIPTHPLFSKRFAALCEAFAHFHKNISEADLIVVPINEISFLSWHSGDVRGTVPFAINSGFDIKYHLCKAAIAGIKALKSVTPECTIMLVEPLIKVHAGVANANVMIAAQRTADQFQAMDIIGGFMCPELGGDPGFLEILGFNYYYNSEWELDGPHIGWPGHEEKRSGLAWLLKMAYDRYRKPLIVSETGHFGEGRAQWITEIAGECQKAGDDGVDLRGVCIYPVTDRPDWDQLDSYSNCGFWDLDVFKNRIPCEDYITAFKQLSQLSPSNTKKTMMTL